MHQAILHKSAEILSATGVSIREVPGGFLSRAFVVGLRRENGETFEIFVRIKKNRNPGSYDKIDQRDTFFRSHLGSLSHVGHPKSLFVDDVCIGAEATITIHAQEYRPSDGSFDYEAVRNADRLDEQQVVQIRQIAKAIAQIHLSRISETDRMPDAYERGALEILINPELTFTTLAHFPSDHPFFGHVEAKYEYLAKMTKAADRQIAQKHHRSCRALHGDFWYSNVLFDEKGCYFIDFSRTPVGEAGIDVGWFLGNLALDAYLTSNNWPREAFENFVMAYVKETGDTDILKNSVLPVFWIAIIRIFPPVYGNPIDGWEKAERIVWFVDECYRKGELFIP